ncbi:hypothetical protein CBL_04114 [Carabus blaptoides fortunei]
MEENEIIENKSKENHETTKDELVWEEGSVTTLGPMEDLFNKNTESFRCMGQIEISRSSIYRDPLYPFPELDDPKLEEVLWGIDFKPEYDDIGCERYKDLCKDEKIMPFRRVLNSLAGADLNMKFFQLSEKAMRTICETLKYNSWVKHVSFQQVILKPELVMHIQDMLQTNKTITSLNLKRCQIGVLGAECLTEGIRKTVSLTELDLSFNNLGDEGIEMLAPAIQFNSSIRKLNLSHNNLWDGALVALRPAIEDNYTLHELDLAWNNFFTPIGMQALMLGLSDNIALKSLDLSWNGIGEKDTVRFILQYLKSESPILEHLNLSNNRITGPAVKMLRNGLKSNESLISLNLSYNPLTADEVEILATVFFEQKEKSLPLNRIDFGETWVKKSFIQVHNRIKKMGYYVSYGGIYSNYKIKGPDVKEMLLKRAKYVAIKPKKKKQRKDIGHFMLQLENDPVNKENFEGMIKKQKIKLDKDLINIMTKTWETSKKAVDIQNMKEKYLQLYPDTKLPPKKKKGKGKKKKNKEKNK